jgi:hypothetical protein
MLVLGVLWWSWVGYSWFTSVVDPEEGAVRLVMFAAMAAFLVAALCVPEAFGDSALLFACAYGVVRFSQIALMLLASRDDPALRHSTLGLAGGTALGVGLILTASAFDGPLQVALWVLALLLDMGEPYLFGAEGWKLVPGHFAERHGLILIIALGESIVAIGVGAESGVDAGAVAAAVLVVPATAMLGGTALYLLAHVAFRLRNLGTLNRQRLACALVLVALVPLAVELPSLATLAVLAGVLAALVGYEGCGSPRHGTVSATPS